MTPTQSAPRRHYGARCLALSFVAALVLTGCAGTPTVVTTPVLANVRLGAVNLPIAPMPIPARSSQYVIATIAAPWPADLRVSLNGTDLERVVSSNGREVQLADQGVGFFAVDNVDPNPSPAVWRVRISTPPIHQCALAPFTIAIRHVVSGAESAPLNISFASTNTFSLVGTTGRIAVLEYSTCSPVSEFRLERRTAGGAFANVTTLPNTGGRYRDTGLTPSTPFQYRLVFVRTTTTPGTKFDLGSTPDVAAMTTALMSGTENLDAFRPDATVDSHHWQISTFDPLAKGGVSLAIGAVITRVQNDGNRQIFVTFKDTKGAQVSSIPIAANSSVTSPFAGMVVAGDWDPIRTTGSASGLPDTWPMKVFWVEPP